MLYKTNLCKFYAKGMCKRGQKCSWAHGENDIRPFPAFYKTRMCYNWIYFGACDREPCTYAHSQMELRGSGKALRLCNYFFRNGNCPKGSRCPMAHDPSQLDSTIRNQGFLTYWTNSKFETSDTDCSDIPANLNISVASSCFAIEDLPDSPQSIRENQLQELIHHQVQNDSDQVQKGIDWSSSSETFDWSQLITNGVNCKADPVEELWALLKRAGSDGTSLTTSCDGTVSPCTGDRSFDDPENSFRGGSFSTITPTESNIFNISGASSLETCKREDHSDPAGENTVSLTLASQMWHNGPLRGDTEVFQLAQYLTEKTLRKDELFEAC